MPAAGSVQIFSITRTDTMQEELQPLIDRIRKEAVDTAQQEAGRIIADAEKKARDIVADAEHKAKSMLENADKDAAAFTERSLNTLSQASRDVLISIGEGIDRMFSDIVAVSVTRALDNATVEEMLIRLAQAYGENQGKTNRIEVLLGKEDGEKLATLLRERLVDKFSGGVEIQVDNSAFRGFKVSFSEGSVYHDFSADAIAEAISAFLRPQLAEIVHNALDTLSGETD